ncbi:ATP-dependent DNA helicase PIF1-like protein [Elsinoe fawcettii]|nr:ATP-dependent DNA helicase PIF1-like protein [Elsinoe fawcettii]
MFKQAVERHDAGSSKQKTLSQKSFSSSPPQPQFRKFSQPNLGNSILRPSPSSALNAPFKKQVPVGPKEQESRRSFSSGQGVKRTHNGLQKSFTMHGAFEDTSGSQSKPIFIDEGKPVRSIVPQATNTEYFQEDDFDSDIELDIEDPTSKDLLRSSASKRNAVPAAKPFYPTLPRFRSAAATRSTSPGDSGYGSLPPTNGLPPSSTQAIPWSSSPPEHIESHPHPNPRPQSLQARHIEAHPHLQSAPQSVQARDVDYKSIKTSHPSITGFVTPAKPAKKRTLPWNVAKEQQEQAEQNGPPPPSHQTPHTKSQQLWNPTASAVKQQQKTLREVNKKKSKFVEAEENALKILEKEREDKQRKKYVARVFLSEEQQHVLDLVVESKKSVFFTGSAGTGKSVLLREIIATLRKKHIREPDRVAVTASTGLAACNIGGVTLHSFAGIGLGKEEIPELVKKIRRNQKAKHRWMRTKILVVDEVSMLDGDLFDKLEAIARQIRNNGRPFGGIQLVITGDFFQLPPVPENNRMAKFAFDAGTWTTCIEHTIGLHQVFRQKDPVFAGMLNEMREGRLSASSIQAFHKLSRPLDAGPLNTMATELFPTRNEVENANASRMNQLVGDVKTFEARDGGVIVDKGQRDRLLQNCMAPEIINLKKGAQVMLIKNIDESLVNGSIGTVIGFMSEQTFDRYTHNEEEYLGTQENALKDDDPVKMRTDRARQRIEDNLRGFDTAQRYPVVRFTLNDNTSRDLLCQRETWKIELPNGEIQASRSQIPLILAWALSIHKAQGQTLERVKVDLGKVFEKGQAYVALSRATSMAGLQVLRFDAKKVMAHEKVRTFYANLSRVEAIEGDGKKKRKTAVSNSASEYENRFMNGDL